MLSLLNIFYIAFHALVSPVMICEHNNDYPTSYLLFSITFNLCNRMVNESRLLSL